MAFPPSYTVALDPVSTIDSREQVLQGGVATVLRREYYFEDRSTTMFSEFDLRSFTAYAGMGDADKGLSKGAVVLENLPAQLIARPTLTREAPSGAAIYLTAEYLDADGNVLQTQHYQRGENAAVQAVNTLPMDDEIVLITPEGFDGVLKLSWGIVDANADTTLKIAIDKE